MMFKTGDVFDNGRGDFVVRLADEATAVVRLGDDSYPTPRPVAELLIQGSGLKLVPPPDPDVEMAKAFVEHVRLEMTPWPTVASGMASRLKAARADGHAAGVAEFRERAVAVLTHSAKNETRTVITEAALSLAAEMVQGMK